jgi:hypothetical protein
MQDCILADANLPSLSELQRKKARPVNEPMVSVAQASGFSRSWDIGVGTYKHILTFSNGLLHIKAKKVTAERNEIYYSQNLAYMQQPSGLSSAGKFFV